MLRWAIAAKSASTSRHVSRPSSGEPARDADRAVAGERADLERVLGADQAHEERQQRALVGRDLHRGVRHLAGLGADPVEDLVGPCAPLVQIGEQLGAARDPVSGHASAGYEDVEGQVGCRPCCVVSLHRDVAARESRRRSSPARGRRPRRRRSAPSVAAGVQPSRFRPNSTTNAPPPGADARRRVAGKRRPA